MPAFTCPGCIEKGSRYDECVKLRDAARGADVMDAVSTDDAKIQSLQAAKGRIRSAPSRSGSGAEPLHPKKLLLKTRVPPPHPTLLLRPSKKMMKK